MTGVKGGPCSLSSASEFTSSDSVSGSGFGLVWVSGAVGTRQVIGTSECT